MKRNRPDLIVPIRDRRQSKRYLTLRNAGITFAVLSILFIGVTIRSEMEPRSSTESAFGRLFERELPKVEPKPVEVVTEAAAPIDDHAAADPMLVAPAAREQWLHDSSNTASAATTIEPIAAPVTVAPRAGPGSKVAIVGGPEGVAVVEQKRKAPLLTGGFGRQ